MVATINNNMERRWLTTAELCAYTGLGRNAATQFSQKAGALKKVSIRKNLHDKVKIDKALESL